MNPGPQQSQHADVFGNHVSEGLGFVLQQDGANMNEFMAAYGAGGGRWVMTEAVPLVAGRWQHVALVKTPEELRFYLNGVLVASEPDAAPARPSPMPIAVGLGYTAQERCFRGRIDDARPRCQLPWGWATPLKSVASGDGSTNSGSGTKP
ncbi:MAG: LamG domain-containing protein [Pirellulaceae bacterium]|nr:LamG domain-containing protein [Pirellulaceae bacterium]